MNNKDQYTLEDNGFTLLFKKNGLLHREIGPASFWKMKVNEEKYLHLGDEHLYTLKHIHLDDRKKYNYTIRRFGSINEVNFYLNGELYSKKEFKKIKEKIKLKNELSDELNSNQNNIKKVKI